MDVVPFCLFLFFKGMLVVIVILSLFIQVMVIGINRAGYQASRA